MSATVRPAAVHDADGIAAVHVGTWRRAYAGIVPAAHLDSLSVAARAERWRTWFAAGTVSGQTVWVAEAGGRIVGFANAGPSRDDGATGLGEVRAIYVDAEHWDRGVGRALLERSVAALRSEGFAAATLWVLAENRRARAFYERHGWRADGAEKEIDLGGARLLEIRYRLDLRETAGSRPGS